MDWFEVFTGSNCETVKTELNNKFKNSDHKSEKDTIINKVWQSTTMRNGSIHYSLWLDQPWTSSITLNDPSLTDWLTHWVMKLHDWSNGRVSFPIPHFPIGRYSFRMNRRKQFLLCPKGAFTAEPRAQITLSRTESDMWQPTPLLAYTCMVWYTDGWHIKGKTGADLNAWPLQWGGHFAGFVWVHLSL